MPLLKYNSVFFFFLKHCLALATCSPMAADGARRRAGLTDCARRAGSRGSELATPRLQLPEENRILPRTEEKDGDVSLCPPAPLLPQAAGCMQPTCCPPDRTGPGVLATLVLSRGWGTGVKAPSQWCESVG